MDQNEQSLIEVELTGWAYGGEALGRAPDGRMIFAPFCIPGEKVRGIVAEERASWARILPQGWLQASPERLEARCPHFTECGGCHYQHLHYDHQLRVKAAIVSEQLERIGGLSNPPVTTTIPSPEPWFYRNNMRYRVLPDGSLGFVRYRETIPFAIKDCSLPDPELADLWRRIALPPGGPVGQVSLRIGTAGDAMVIFHGDSAEITDFEADFPVSVIWQDEEAWRVLAGESALLFEIQGFAFHVSPPSFFQVNTGILPGLVDLVLSALRLEPGVTFFDLYAGVGLFSAFASQRGAAVYAIEQSISACADFEMNLRECVQVSLYEAPVETALPAIGASPDVILVDPPRSGLSRPALDAIVARQAGRLVYLSCDPGTLARDAKRLRDGGYELEQIAPIDIFPQTFHIETLSSWNLK